MSDREGSIGLPSSAWPNLSLNGLWSGFVSNGIGERQMKLLHAEQDQIFNEAQSLFDKWSARQHQTVQSTWTLMEELQRSGDGREAAVAWIRWYGGTVQRIAEDTKDQLAFGCMAAECCTTGMAGRLKAYAVGAIRSDKDNRGDHEQLVRDHAA